MPTYEYACKGCGEHLEVVQSFKDDALTECPGCGGTLRKVFSAAGIIFKGSGWHIKDYASSKGAANPAAGGSSSDDPSKVKSDSATASSSDTPSGSGSSESKTSDGSGTSSASGSEGSSSASAGSSSSSEKKSA